MIKVIFPRGDDFKEHLLITLKIIQELEDEFNKTKKISLDFSKVSWILPCSIILISNKIKELLSQKFSAIKYIPPINETARDYIDKVGFPLGNKEDGSSYVSIRHFSNDKRDKTKVNKESNNLLNKIEQKIPGEFGVSIQYILGELTDNIDNHSRFSWASLMAQYFPKKKHIDLAVFDNGITIPSLFEENSFSFNKDFEAIKKAVLGEITTKKNEMSRGFGLRTCKNLSTEGLKGKFYIVSRKGLVVVESGKESVFEELSEFSLKGTLLYFRLNTPDKEINIYPYVE